jgi:eukaryotic-like serine/threonine-protein kinase
MTSVSTVAELLERIRKSGLVTHEELNTFLAESVNAPHDEDAPEMLNRLVDSCLLTRFQADRIAAGKYKGFFLGGYVILDILGSGGMGQVFLAEHTTMRRLVAIKVLHLPVVDDPVARERFIREARSAAALNHPNIVRVFDLNREGKLLYLVMEFIEGTTLQHWVAQKGALPPSSAASYVQQIARALQHAHECGLVHRDVKPSNLLIDRTGTARLLDLGLARHDSDNDSKLTGKIGTTILGTADYLAPEQALDSHTVDIRADIYSLGATLYFLLAGRVMFPEGRTAQKLMYQQWKEPTPIRELVPKVSEALAAVLNKCLTKKREERYQTPAELVQALSAVCVESPILPASELVVTPPKRRWVSRPVDVNASLSNFKLELSPAQSPLYQNSTVTAGLLDSRTQLNSPASSPGSSGNFDTKPNAAMQTTPIIVTNPPRPQADPKVAAQPTSATGTSSNALIFASLGMIIGLLSAAVLYLLLTGR